MHWNRPRGSSRLRPERSPCRTPALRYGPKVHPSMHRTHGSRSMSRSGSLPAMTRSPLWTVPTATQHRPPAALGAGTRALPVAPRRSGLLPRPEAHRAGLHGAPPARDRYRRKALHGGPVEADLRSRAPRRYRPYGVSCCSRHALGTCAGQGWGLVLGRLQALGRPRPECLGGRREGTASGGRIDTVTIRSESATSLAPRNHAARSWRTPRARAPRPPAASRTRA